MTSDEKVLALWREHEGNGPGAVLEFARKIRNLQRIADAELCATNGYEQIGSLIRSKIEPEG